MRKGSPRKAKDRARNRRPRCSEGTFARKFCEKRKFCQEIARRRQPVSDNRRSLERAKGFEPSTPTLARLCSTPELHPHPRMPRRRGAERLSYAKYGRRMQQAPCGKSTQGRPNIPRRNLIARSMPLVTRARCCIMLRHHVAAPCARKPPAAPPRHTRPATVPGNGAGDPAAAMIGAFPGTPSGPMPPAVANGGWRATQIGFPQIANPPSLRHLRQ